MNFRAVATDRTQPGSSPGWRATLTLALDLVRGQTRLTGYRHEGPLRVQKPFSQDDGSCHIYLLHPPGGLVAGDDLSIDVAVGEDARALLTSPSAGKFYRCLPGALPQKFMVRLKVAAGAHLEWLPQETIFYDQAAAEVSTILQLHESATYIGWDIQCLGRRASGEDFSGGRLRQRTQVQVGERLIHREQLEFSQDNQEAAWALANKSVVGTLVAITRTEITESTLTTIREQLDARFLGATLRGRTFLVRYLGDSAEACRTAFEQVRQCLHAVGSFHGSTGEAGVEAPRIWKT